MLSPCAKQWAYGAYVQSWSLREGMSRGLTVQPGRHANTGPPSVSPTAGDGPGVHLLAVPGGYPFAGGARRSPADIPSQAVPGGARRPEEYGLVVLDNRGVSTQVATWAATPGTAASPTATIAVRVDDIRRVDIVDVPSGRTLLSAAL